jgi:hypothetical protein
VAAQSFDELGGRQSILVEQRLDHAVLDQLMTEAERAADPWALAEAVAELSQRALRHAFAEETVLFPACRKHLGEAGEAWTADVEAKHQEINELLQQISGADVDADTAAAVARVCALIRADAREEEDELLPQLQAVLEEEALRALGSAWQAARVAAPIRPHPRVPRRPPANALAAPVLTVTDRLRGPAAPAPRPRAGALHVVGTGLLAGAVGVAAMTLAEKLEQRVTGRPNSTVPRRTLQALTGLPARTEGERWALNHVMHWGQGTGLGILRAVMTGRGRSGVRPSLVFAVIRLTVDQTLENATGVGSPPHTWPRTELVLDVGHKVIYALAAGAVADRLLRRP